MPDQGTLLMEAVQWFTHSDPPRSATMNCYVEKMRGAEHLDAFCSALKCPDLLVSSPLKYDAWSILFQGHKGTMIRDDVGYNIQTLSIA